MEEVRETEHSTIAPLPSAPLPWLYLTYGPSALEGVLDPILKSYLDPILLPTVWKLTHIMAGAQRFALALFPNFIGLIDCRRP